MLGAIIGDIVGSPYEFGSGKTKNFVLFDADCRPTDDSVLTIAVGCACAEANCYNEYEFKSVLAKRLKEINRNIKRYSLVHLLETGKTIPKLK